MPRLFHGVIWLSAGDLIAKALNFFAFIYLARILGASAYGVLEFAISLISYFLLAADSGLELWATRAVAQGRDVRELVSRIVPLRFILSIIAFGGLVAVIPLLPKFPGLSILILLFGVTLLTQAINLKWLFMGREEMRKVAGGLILSQLVFAAAVLLLFHEPEDVLWVPVLRLLSDLLSVSYFGYAFFKEQGFALHFTLRGSMEALRPALTMGAAHGFALMNYNFDTVLLGFLKDSTSVGLYNAAYKPVTVVLAIPVSYFLGLLPGLARTFAESAENFRFAMIRSLRLMALFGFPAGVIGSLLAAPIILSLFGHEYRGSIPALRILIWSAVIVILRGTYRQALNAAGKQQLDLRCAASSTILNVGLNFALIPNYGITGAAVATLLAEMLWLAMALHYSHQAFVQVKLLPLLSRPALAGLTIAIVLFVASDVFWVLRVFLGILVYLGILWLFREPELRALLQKR